MNKSNSFENLKCIWMASNIVDYKLCDRNFDCDNCMFDLAIRNTSRHSSMEDVQVMKSISRSVIQNIISRISNCEFKSNYSYFNNNLVGKNLFDDTFYLGFNSIAACLLDNITFFDSYSDKKVISKGDDIINIKGEWGEIIITSPINFTWLGKLSNTKETGYNEKWFGLVEIPKNELENSMVSISNYHRDLVNTIKQLDSYISDYPDVGTTLLDGGQEIKALFQSIGKERYLEMLEKKFKTKYKVMKN